MYYYYIFAISFLLVNPNVAQNWHWFSPELNCWITQQKVPTTWEDAQRNCEIDDAVLASPLNPQLFEYMKTLIGEHNHSAAYFIGTRANHSSDDHTVQYVSIEGKYLNDMPKAVFDEIDQIDLTQGDCLSMDQRGVRAVSCWDRLPYICYSKNCGSAAAPTTSTSTPPTTTTTTTTTQPTTTPPPPGYTYEPATGSYYKFYDRVHVTWFDANARCTSEGAHVVVLNDAVEANIVAAIGPITVGNSPLWLWTGLCDNRPGGVSDWRTVNGEPMSEVYNNWRPNRPNTVQPACALFNKIDKTLTSFIRTYNNFDVAFTCEISP